MYLLIWVFADNTCFLLNLANHWYFVLDNISSPGITIQYKEHIHKSTGDSSNQLSNIVPCGLAIKSEVNGNNATVEVHAGFASSISGDYRLTVYLIEDKVMGTGTGYDQMNFYDSDSDSPFFELGNPILGYEHNHTLRLSLSEPLGDLIGSSFLVPGGEYIREYEVDISDYDKDNLSIVAFVNYVGPTYLEHEVLNVQNCRINSTKDWD